MFISFLQIPSGWSQTWATQKETNFAFPVQSEPFFFHEGQKLCIMLYKLPEFSFFQQYFPTNQLHVPGEYKT